MNKILKLTLILFLVCAIVAGILGAINEITKERIAVQNEQKTAKAYNAVLPADSYIPIEFSPHEYPTIDAVAKAADDSGYVVQTTFSGAQGSITMVVGVKPDYTCSGISIISHSETSGLGAVAASSSEKGISFRESFIGKGENLRVADIDAITGATITTKAVTYAVKDVIQAVKELG